MKKRYRLISLLVLFYSFNGLGMEQPPSFPIDLVGNIMMELPSVTVMPQAMQTFKSLKFVCKRFHSYISSYEADYKQVAPLIKKLAAKEVLIPSCAIAKFLNCAAATLYIEQGNGLIEACFEKKQDKIAELLGTGADANFTNAIGNSPLNTIVFFHEIWRYRKDIRSAFNWTDEWIPSKVYDCVPYSDDEKAIIKLLLFANAKLTLKSPGHMFTSIEHIQKCLNIYIETFGCSVIPVPEGLISSKIKHIGGVSTIQEKVKSLFKAYPELEALLHDYLS